MTKIRLIIKRWQLFLLPGIAILFTLILIFVVLLPKVNQIRNLYLQTKEASARLGRLTLKLSELEGIDEGALVQRKELALKAVPNNKSVMETVSSISNFVRESDLLITSFEVSPGEISTQSASKKKEKLDRLRFAIDLEGQPDKVMVFIEKVENLLPLISLNTFNLNAYQNQSRLSLVIESYSAVLPEGLGKIDSPLMKVTDTDEEVLNKIKTFESLETEAGKIYTPPEAIPTRSAPRQDPFSI